MKITTLIENSKQNNNLNCEHGLSMFIETSEYNILFDTGQTGNFIDNSKKLNIDLNKTDYIILSHAHYDHCGGIKRLLDNFNLNSQLCISQYFFSNMEKYRYLNKEQSKNNYKYIGINFDEKFIKSKNIPIKYISQDVIEIAPSIYIFTNFQNNNKYEILNSNMKMMKNNKLITDTFKDEIVLGVDTKEGLLVFVGCSHPGIMNILSTIAKRSKKKIYGVIGGTHLVNSSMDRINATIKLLKDLDIKLIGVSHCTGEKAVSILSKNCSNFMINCTGTKIEI